MNNWDINIAFFFFGSLGSTDNIRESESEFFKRMHIFRNMRELRCVVAHVKSGNLGIGDYITTDDGYLDYDTIVVTSLDDPWIGLRYLTFHAALGKEVWARGMLYVTDITFNPEHVAYNLLPDERSRWVVGLQGPYPENIYK